MNNPLNTTKRKVIAGIGAGILVIGIIGSAVSEPELEGSVSTDLITTEAPAPTEAPVTEAPAPTEPPVTEPPVTEPPVTEPPVTEPPVTEPPVTEPPVTEAPTTTVDPVVADTIRWSGEWGPHADTYSELAEDLAVEYMIASDNPLAGPTVKMYTLTSDFQVLAEEASAVEAPLDADLLVAHDLLQSAMVLGAEGALEGLIAFEELDIDGMNSAAAKLTASADLVTEANAIILAKLEAL